MDRTALPDARSSSPFPDPLSPVLDLLVHHVEEAYERGDLDLHEAIVHAAACGWYEGHIEGEDSCRGCRYRGDDSEYAGNLRRYRG